MRQEEILQKVEDFCKRHSMGPYEFSQRALGHTTQITADGCRLRQLRPRTIAKLNAWMAQFERELTLGQRVVLDFSPRGGLVNSARMSRLIKKVTIDPVDIDGCWIWTAGHTSCGYGTITIHNRPTRAHRVFYEFFCGNVPDGLVLDHLCRVRDCVNPKHLEPVTQAENTRRGERWQLKKTHCPQGHPYSGTNLVRTKTGGRACRICRQASFDKYYEKHRGPKRKSYGPRKPFVEATTLQKRVVTWPDSLPPKPRILVFVDGKGRRATASPLL